MWEEGKGWTGEKLSCWDPKSQGRAWQLSSIIGSLLLSAGLLGLCHHVCLFVFTLFTENDSPNNG